MPSASIAENNCCSGSVEDSVEDDVVLELDVELELDEADVEDASLCSFMAMSVIRMSPLTEPCVLPVMPVPETADVDEELDEVSLDVSVEDDEEELLVSDDSSEASIWLALLAADIASDCNMAVSKGWWLE